MLALTKLGVARAIRYKDSIYLLCVVVREKNVAESSGAQLLDAKSTAKLAWFLSVEKSK